MERMNEEQFRRLFPKASKSTLEANVEVHNPKPERHKAAALAGVAKGKEKGVGRIKVSYRLFRVRLLDVDNAPGSTKDCTDGLCRCGLIPGDDPASITLHVEQEKVKTYAEERTEIEIEYPI